MSRLTRDGTAESVSRDQILRCVRGQGNVDFPCSADHEVDWHLYPVGPYSAICDEYTWGWERRLSAVTKKDSTPRTTVRRREHRKDVKPPARRF